MKDYKDLKVGDKLGAKSNQHWEINVDITPHGDNEHPHASFLPQSGRTRAQPHKKLNECDH